MMKILDEATEFSYSHRYLAEPRQWFPNPLIPNHVILKKKSPKLK